ncbi:MAG: hypothetical protein ACI9MR_000302 [Myxococcota bacterium]|jgi:hypothetical protein
MRRSISLIAALSVTLASSSAVATPKPKTPQRYDFSQLGFNGGEPYRLAGAEVEALLGEPGIELFQFASPNWMMKNQTGSFVPIADVVERFPQRSSAELVDVFQLDLEGDGTFEMLVVAKAAALSPRHRYAPTLLAYRGEKFRAVWSAFKLPGERFQVVDIRDLNVDGKPEFVLSGESGDSGVYQFTAIVGQGKTRTDFVTLAVDHVDSVHYVDLDRDQAIEIVARTRVGRRGPARQWTYIDRLHRWSRGRFRSADERFPGYHNEHTLPTLIGEIIDHYDAKLPILEEKIDAIKTLRAEVVSWAKRPRGYYKRKVKALRSLRRKRMESAMSQLTALDTSYPYDAQVLIGLARVHSAEGTWDRVLEFAIRALTVDPTSRDAWWWSGVALSQLQERSSAVASFYLAVRLTGKTERGVAFLRARRAEAGMEAVLQDAIDQALTEL